MLIKNQVRLGLEGDRTLSQFRNMRVHYSSMDKCHLNRLTMYDLYLFFNQLSTSQMKHQRVQISHIHQTDGFWSNYFSLGGS